MSKRIQCRSSRPSRRRGRYPRPVLDYVLTETDLAAFAAWQARGSGEDARRGRRSAVIGAWLVGVAAYLVVSAVLTIPLLLGREWWLAGGGEVLALVGGLALGWAEWRSGRLAERLVSRPYRRRAREALARTGGDRRVWLDADGLNVAVANRSEHLGWARLTGLVETDDHVFVLVGTNAAHVIPKRAGPGVAALAAEIRGRMQDAG